jgi:hypothetical protein
VFGCVSAKRYGPHISEAGDFGYATHFLHQKLPDVATARVASYFPRTVESFMFADGDGGHTTVHTHWDYRPHEEEPVTDCTTEGFKFDSGEGRWDSGAFTATCPISWGTRWLSYLRQGATSRKVAGLIPDGAIGIFL